MAALVWLAGVPEAWFRRVAVVAAVTAVSVGVTGSYLPNPAAAAVEAPAQASAPESVATGKPQRGSHGALVARDGVSAQVNARLAGERVEDLSQRTESSSTYAMPDGSWQSALSLSPVWVRTGGDGTAEDDWAEFDATLQAAEGGFGPVAHPAGITVSGAQKAGRDGVSVVASLTDPETGTTSELTFPGDLPAPQVTGERAVFANVEPGVDMVVDITGGGFEQYFVLHEAPTDPAAVALDLGLSAEGATVEQPKKALVDLVVDGEVAARAATPMMWDATYDAQLANPVTQEWSAEQPPLWAGTPADLDALTVPDAETSTDESAGTAEAGVPDPGVTAVVPVEVAVEDDGAEVTMTPGQEFLTDPDVQYPVVVDPSVSLGLPRDTFVQTNWSDDASLQTDLRLGTYNGTDKARTFINVDTSAIKGKKVTSAKLNLWQYHSWSCEARQWEVWVHGLGGDGHCVDEPAVVDQEVGHDLRHQGVWRLVRGRLVERDDHVDGAVVGGCVGHDPRCGLARDVGERCVRVEAVQLDERDVGQADDHGVVQLLPEHPGHVVHQLQPVRLVSLEHRPEQGAVRQVGQAGVLRRGVRSRRWECQGTVRRHAGLERGVGRPGRHECGLGRHVDLHPGHGHHGAERGHDLHLAGVGE
ncbi:DNRLRE domain-containing protein [Isoptericola sediminis]|uniref:DNRLRE domain-containing protein n=1 Tax=Isoptericola sediminis TaxID=2733572 RepID=UPI0024840E8D|nr:DNRLRE domain-containing protein [Isoptericola sediminis]